MSQTKAIDIEALMHESGVKFGTSGARGLVSAMTDEVCVAYTLAFLLHLRAAGLSERAPVVVGGDRRPSTPRIARAVAFAAQHLGHPVEFAGYVPSPAVALRGLGLKAPSIMVTGSHIPDDRNGIKFNSQHGEATKADEAAVRAMGVELPDVFDDRGMLRPDRGIDLGEPHPAARQAYLERFESAFAPGCLKGLRIGVYGHSAVGRDLLVELYEKLGARVEPLGFSDTFVPVDTEAIRKLDVEQAQAWAAGGGFDALVSTDGDSDRPLISDERGKWIRGDVAGILVAHYLGADAVVTPVSCNTAVEKAFDFRVLRTRIGSPFVIEGMQRAKNEGARVVVGYEANGGFLSATDASIPGGSVLPALPTRDAIIVHLAVLLAARSAGLRVSELVGKLPSRFTASDRDQAFATDLSARVLGVLQEADDRVRASYFELGAVSHVDETDGLRLTFEGGQIVHLRPSGNAPELRCYAEASSEARAEELVRLGLDVARRIASGLA